MTAGRLDYVVVQHFLHLLLYNLPFFYEDSVRRSMRRARVVLGNDAVLRNGGLAYLRRCRKAVGVFGKEVNQLPSFRARKLRVNVELRWRRTALLRWRCFVSNGGDFDGVVEFLDVANGCPFC